mmetsp:Transcript_66288/g.192058  ORF Transcript_66288/g.192058 Transcript_66288/m.192058 type:complete len:302 (-) Transcript_66288:290-1195(-)
MESIFGKWSSQDGLVPSEHPGCHVNAFVAFSYLNQAGSFVAETSADCKGNLAHDSPGFKVCAANVLGVIQSFWNAGAYLASLASQCMEGHNQQAECASLVMGIVGTLTEFFQSVTVSLQSCGMPNFDFSQWEGPATGSAPETTPIVTPRPGLLGTIGRMNLTQGRCFINAASSIPSLAQAGWLVEEATQGCRIQDTDFQRRECAADALSIISALGNVANFIADAAIKCGQTLQLPAQCVKDLGPQFQSLGTLASDAVLLQDTCMRGKNLTAGAFAGERRLSEVPAAKASPGTGGLPGPQFV